MRGSTLFTTIIYILITINAVFATHFRYGNIVWRIPDPDNNPTLVEFKVSLSYKLSVGTLIPIVGTLLNPGSLDFGDVPFSLVTNLVDNVLDLLTGSYTVRYLYPPGAKNYTVSHSSGGRYFWLNNNANNFYNISTVVTIGQNVVNRAGKLVPNNSPVASMLPVVTVYTNEVTRFRIPAYDRESSSLIFSLASAVDMGSAASTQPPGLSVNSTGGVTFNTAGLALGFWNTQIKVSDGTSYVVVDFIFLVTVRPASLPCLVPSLPIDGLSLTLYANVQFSLTLTPSIATGSLPAIISTLLPSTLTLSVNVLAQATLAWTPTINDVGTYAITFGCRTPLLGLPCSALCQQSVVLNVVPPICGYGTATSAGCLCPIGYDLATNCTTCASGFYGPNCTACQCARGTCASGMTNTGACTCPSGWKGVRCDVAIKPCSFTLPGYIRQIVNSTSSVVNPITNTLLVTGAATTVGLSAFLPLVPPKLDVMLLVDTSVSGFSLLNLQASLGVNAFVSNLLNLSPSVYIGLSTFSSTSCLVSLSVGVKLSLTASVGDLNAALGLYLSTSLSVLCVTKPQGYQLGAMITAAGSSSGWRSDALKVIIVVTETVFGEGGPNYAVRADLRTALLGINAIPIFVTPSTVQATYNALVTDLGFGLAATMLSTWSNSYTVAAAATKLALTNIWTVIQDPQNITTLLTPNSVVAPPLYANLVSLDNARLANQSLTTLSAITVNIVGWGVATLTPQVNQAPVASVVSVTTREDIGATVPFNGNDADGDTLSIIIEALPTKGKLYTNSTASALVAFNTTYLLPDGSSIPYFYYVPNLHYNGTDSIRFSLSDGCTKSVAANASLTITFYNYPPVAYGNATFTNENVNLTLTFNVSDVEDSNANLASFIRSLPDSSLATLYHINNGSAVQINDQIAASASHSVKYVPKTYACCESSTFTYQVRDTGNQFSSLATVSTFINHVNQAPTASSSVSISVDRAVATAITLTVTDPDLADFETFTITAIGTGTWSDSANTTISSTPYNFTQLALGASNTGSLPLYYTAPAFATAGATFSFYVTDAAGLRSSTVTVTISINANQPPVATAISGVTSAFTGQSAVYTLSGTDPDPADTPSTLQISIVSLPSKGVLNVNGANITSGQLPLLVNNGASFYVIGNQQAGTDQFTYRVIDTLGSTSALTTVSLRFIAVNRPPTASIGTLVTREDIEIVGRINAYDPDGDTMTAYISALPGKGTLKQLDGTVINITGTALTDSNLQFRYLPALNDFGSPYTTFAFYVDDNSNTANSQSSVVTASINVTFYNYPPVALSTTVNVPEESSATVIYVNTTDIETPNAVTAIILSLPSSSAGVLTDLSGNALVVGSVISSPWTFQFTPTPLFVGTASFQFKANDGTQDSNTAGTLTINVTHVDLPPTSQVYLGTAVRQVSFPITLVAGDPNLGDSLTITITSYGGYGDFFYPDSRKRAPVAFSPAPFALPNPLVVPQSRTTSMVVSYIAPASASGNNYANISFYVTDQTGLSSAITNTSINIATNNPPTVNAVGTIGVTQDVMSAPFSLNGTDIDFADVLSLQVILASLPTKGTLYFVNGTAIVSAPVTLTAASAVSLTYLTNQRGSDSFTFYVQDVLLAQSVTTRVSIAITNTNHPPVAQWLTLSTGIEDTVLVVTQMGASDPDADDTVFTYFISSAPTVGNITQANGANCTIYPCQVLFNNTVLFTPLKDGNGNPYATFSFYVVDSHGARSVSDATATIAITAVNDPPVAYPSAASGNEGRNMTVTLNITDVDTPQSGLSVVIVSLPSSSMGYLTTAAGVPVKVGDIIPLQSLIFVPVPYANGATSFSFQATDGQSYSSITSCSITLVPVIDPPTAGISLSSPITVSKSSTTSFNLLAIDPDAGETYTFYLVSYKTSSGASGSLTTTSGQNAVTASTGVIGTAASVGTYTPLGVTFTAGPNVETINVTFLVSDGTYNSSQLTLVLRTSDNIPPTASAPSPSPLITQQDTMSGSVTMNGNDPDDSRPVRIVIVSLPQNGVLYVNSSYAVTQIGPLDIGVTSLTYLPSTLYFGTDSYTYVISDAEGANSAVQTVNIQVQHVNHAPTVTVGAINAVEDTPLTISQIFANDIDGDNVTLVITAAPSSGSFKLLDGTPINSFPANISSPFQFIYVPAPDANGPVTFSVYVTDGTANSATVTATINVAAVNDAPVARDTTLTLTENSPATSFTINVTDVDSPNSALVARILSLPDASLGMVTLNGAAVSVGQFISSPRTLVFTPASFASGSGNISFVARDETLFSANTGYVYITLGHVNHAPQVSASSPVVVTRGVETAISFVGTDVDTGDVISFTVTAVNLNGGTLSSAPNGASPITAGGVVFSSGTITAQTASIAASLYYIAPATASGSGYASFTVTTTDQGGLISTPLVVSVSIAHNNPPTANAVSVNVTQDQSSSPVTLSGTDVDVADANSLKVYITALPTKGYLSQGSVNITSTPTLITGPIVYTTSERGTDSFSFQVVDNLNSASPSIQVPIKITAVNHAPTVSFNAPNLTATEGINALVNQISAFDQDGDAVTVYIATLPTKGTLTQYDGTPITSVNTAITDSLYRVYYIPGSELSTQSTSFSFYGSDNTGTSNSNSSVYTVPVIVTHVNRPPVVYDSVLPALTYGGSGSTVLTPNITDVDTPSNQLFITVVGLPDSTIGALTYNGIPVAVGDVIPYPFSTISFIQSPTGQGYTTFTFTGGDGISTSTSAASYGIGVKSLVNTAPVAVAAATATAQRGVPLSIQLGAHDDDILETFTFSVSAASAGGNFSYTGVSLSPPSFSITLAQNQNVYVTNAILSFTAPANAAGSSYLVLDYTVSDGSLTSNSVEITVGIAANNLPVAVPPSVTLLEDGNSTTFTLSGTDADLVDANSLSIIINSLPSLGTLYLSGVGPITTTGGVYPSGSTFFIVGTPLAFGDDSFSYQVQDNVGGTSASQTVSVTITHVNHAPTAGIHLPEGTMNQPLTFQIYGQDVDPESLTTAYITQLPSQGYLTQSDGTIISGASASNPVAVTSSTGQVIYIPPTNVYGSNIASLTFFVADNSGASNDRSPIMYGNISIARADLPPVAYDSSVSAADGGNISVLLNATDPQGYTTSATITQFPTSGTLYRPDGTIITPSDPSVGPSNTVIYVPVKGTYDQTFTFSYQVTSSPSGLSSNTASVSASVYRVYGAPVYTGQTAFSIPENSQANILFSATSESGFYSVKIINTASVGKLVFVDGSISTDITGAAPYLMNNTNSENRAKYTPPTNTSGDNLVSIIVQVIDAHGISDPVIITISVYHINVAPTVAPTTFITINQTFSWTTTVTIPENECATISWNLTDSDSPASNLSSLISSLPFRGKLYTRLEDGTQGDLITGQVTINYAQDGLFHVVYCPEAGKSGNNYASFSIIGFDGISFSDRRYANIKVYHTNQAPTVNITQNFWNTTIGTQTIVTGVSVGDVDASVFSIKFVLTVEFDNGTGDGPSPVSANALSLFNYDNTLCTTTDANITCVATVDKLNVFLTQITYSAQDTTGNATITVFVDDMGDGTGLDAKNVSDTVTVEVLGIDSSKGAGNNNVLTATVASAAVVGAAAAAGVYGYLRKRSPPTSTFFGLEHGLANGVINENPLYEGGVVMENTLYRAPTFGMQKI